MTYKKISKMTAICGLVVSAMAMGGCSSVGDLLNSSNEVQSQENGNEKEEEQSFVESKTEGYITKYSGKISGYSENITVYGGDGSVVSNGAGSFEWLSDELVEITYDAVGEGQPNVIIADQANVIIGMNLSKETDSKK